MLDRDAQKGSVFLITERVGRASIKIDAAVRARLTAKQSNGDALAIWSGS